MKISFRKVLSFEMKTYFYLVLLAIFPTFLFGFRIIDQNYAFTKKQILEKNEFQLSMIVNLIENGNPQKGVNRLDFINDNLLLVSDQKFFIFTKKGKILLEKGYPVTTSQKEKENFISNFLKGGKEEGIHSLSFLGVPGVSHFKKSSSGQFFAITFQSHGKLFEEADKQYYQTVTEFIFTLLLMAILGGIIPSSFLRSLKKLLAITRMISEGVYLIPDSKDLEKEFQDLWSQFQKMGKAISDQFHSLKESNHQIENLNGTLEEKNNKLKFALVRKSKIIEEERERITKELHGDVLQYLNFLERRFKNLEIQGCRKNPGCFLNHTKEDWQKNLFLASESIEVCLQDMSLSDLRKNGLGKSLRSMLILEKNRYPNFQLNHAIDNVERFEKEIEMVFYRIAQELIHNAIKYSKGEVFLKLAMFDSVLQLEYEDEGPGFDVKKEKTKGRFGINFIFESSESIGADLEYESEIEGVTYFCLSYKGENGE